MKTEIISVGSELTSGISLDTNSCWLSRRLGEAGIEVAFHTTVADDLDANVDVFRIAIERADLVLITGGLGPTLDDLTRDALAKLLGVDLVLDETSLAQIEAMFRARNRAMPERNRVQALVPAGAIPIPNTEGTAPGIWLEQNGKIAAAMPGVPAEMFVMFDSWVLPRLKQRFGAGHAIVHRTLRCFGSGESHIEQMLGDLTRRGREPEIGITASEATISLRITARGKSPANAMATIETDAAFIYRQLGELVYGEDDDDLPSVAARLLKQRRKALSTAESCSGGLLGHLLTENAGISASYLGGVVSYSNQAKEDLLGVPRELLEKHGAVSEEVASAMASGCRTRFQSDLALAITGVAGPGGGTELKPVGLVYVALAFEGGVRTSKYNWAAPRSSVKLRSAKTALNLLRLHLLCE